MSQEHKRNINLSTWLILPAAPVTRTLIGSFSIFNKLHMYTIIFHDRTTHNKSTKDF